MAENLDTFIFRRRRSQGFSKCLLLRTCFSVPSRSSFFFNRRSAFSTDSPFLILTSLNLSHILSMTSFQRSRRQTAHRIGPSRMRKTLKSVNKEIQESETQWPPGRSCRPRRATLWLPNVEQTTQREAKNTQCPIASPTVHLHHARVFLCKAFLKLNTTGNGPGRSDLPGADVGRRSKFQLTPTSNLGALESMVTLQWKHHSHSKIQSLPTFPLFCSGTFSREKFG
jgi:hypothetical protein